MSSSSSAISTQASRSVISVGTASGVSAAACSASVVYRDSIIPRFRYCNVSRWQHLTRSSFGATQYPVAQNGQDQLLLLAVVLNQPWATRH